MDLFEQNFEDFNWKDKTVLIVEDESINVMFFEELLELTNITIIAAENGETAIETVKNNDNIDIILMDIKMPGIDGFEATRQIKQLKPSIPVVAQTAHALESERKKCFLAGCDEYLSKPIDSVRLLSTMKKFLDK